MWNELASYRNHFLQWQLPRMRSERINKIVKYEFKTIQKKRDDCIYCGENECKHSTYFDDRTPLAYGFYALPKLLKEMASDDPDLRWRAINTLAEYLESPLNAERAITEMEIVRKVFNVFMRFRKNYHTPVKDEICQLVRIFNLLSGYLNGAMQIIDRMHLMETFYNMILNKEKQQADVAKILRNLSEKPKVLLRLIEMEKPFEWLTDIFTKDICTPKYPAALWAHLTHFIEIIPEKAISFDIFEMCHKRIQGHLLDYHGWNMKCLALLLRCEIGQELFDSIDGVEMLHTIMVDKSSYIDTVLFIVQALMNGLHSKRALWRSREFTDFPDILMNYIKNCQCPKLHLYCFTCLREMGEMPCIKRYMQVNIKCQLENLKCMNAQNEQIRKDLITWLNTEKYDTHAKVL